MKIDFASKIKELRERAKMTQTDLAQALGVSKSVVSAYENGIRNPSYSVLQELSTVFNVPEAYFLSSGDQEIKITRDISDLTIQQQDIIDAIIRQFRYANYQIKQASDKLEI